MTELRCAYCRRSLTPAEVKRVPHALAWLASFALAMGHGGLWAKSELGRPYCAGCVAKVAGFALFVTAVIVAIASFGVRLWLSGPKLG